MSVISMQGFNIQMSGNIRATYYTGPKGGIDVITCIAKVKFSSIHY